MKFIYLILLPVLLGHAAIAQNEEEDFRTKKVFYSDSNGDRLVVRPVGTTDSFANRLELRIEDETFYDADKSEFQLREIATIRGGGLSNLGLRFYVNEPRFQDEMLQILDEFESKVTLFRRNRSKMKNLDEEWMGQGERALSESRFLTEIQTDFNSRPSVVTLNWDLESNRLWLSLDDFINIDSNIAAPISKLIEQIPEYSRDRERYQKDIVEKNNWINNTLSLPEDAQDEPTADTIDTPTVISEELKEVDEGEKVDLPPSE